MGRLNKVLVINCGSSTIKYQVYDGCAEQVLAKGIVARLGEEGAYISQQTARGEIHRTLPIPSHAEGFALLVEALLDREQGALNDPSEISVVGHRTVHGADLFIEPTLIDDRVIAKMEECVPLAPLHNPANLLGIREAMRLFPNVPHVAVFDTAFHQTMPPEAFLYALPYEYYEKHKIRKYGFHGISCRYVSEKAAHLLGRPLDALRMIICHLGNGVTIAAVSGGKSIDTSIGFATFSGVMMGTRTGDIDPGVTFFLHRQLGMSLDEIESLYYRQSGLLGVSGVSNDMRVVIEKARDGNKRCELAIDMFAYRVRAYIGAYSAALRGLDVLVFTAGIGENSPEIREAVCEGLEFLGVRLDRACNQRAVATDAEISSRESPVRVLVVRTNEEQMIALDSVAVASRGGQTGPDS